MIFNVFQMISTVFEYIKTYLESALGDGVESIKIDTLSKNDGEQNDGGLVMTLLSVDEETSVMPQVPEFKNKRQLKNPDLLLNLNILFSSQAKDYSTALHDISLLLQEFQKTKVIKDEAGNEYRVSLCPVSLEQNLNIWQTLGCRMMPSVVYKVRMLAVHSDEVDETVRITDRIGISYGRTVPVKKEKGEEEDLPPVKHNGREILSQGVESVVFTKVDEKLEFVGKEKWKDHGLKE